MKGNITRRGKNSWRLKFDAGADPVTGERRIIYKTVRGLRRDAEAELVRELRALQTGEHVEPSRLTVGEFLKSWLKTHSANVAAKTGERHREIVEKHLIPELGAMPVQKLTALQIQDYYAKALASGHRKAKRGLSALTVRHHHRVLFQALRQAVRWQLVARNVAEAVTPPKAARKEIQALDAAQVSKVIAAATGTPIALPVLIAATTGLRRGEILGLRWRDIDLDRARLHVAQVLEETRKGVAVKEPKTARSRRTVTLPALAVEALRKHRAEQAETRLMLGLGKDDDMLALGDPLGNPTRPSNLAKPFNRIVRKAGVPRVSFHALRHSHATLLLKAGTNPKIVSERLGHAGVAITLDTYSHVLPGMQENVAEAIDAALRGAAAAND